MPRIFSSLLVDTNGRVYSLLQVNGNKLSFFLLEQFSEYSVYVHIVSLWQYVLRQSTAESHKQQSFSLIVVVTLLYTKL